MTLHNGHKHTILIVDNDSVTQNAIKALLPESHYKTKIVITGEEAIAFCRESGIPDVILLSDIDGIATCKKLHELDKDALLSVIMLTSYFEDDATIEQFCAVGVTACHMKPIRPTLLLQHIRQLLRMKSTHLESKKIENALVESQQTLELALEAAEVGIWDWDVQSGKINFSAGWARMLGYQPEEIDNTFESWQQLVHFDDVEGWVDVITSQLAGDIPYAEFEYRMKTKSGDWIWVQSKGRVMVRDEQGLPLRMMGTQKDITQKRRDEELLRQQAEQLQERNEELDAFAYTVAHDLKNPIASIMGFASLVRSYYHRMTPENVLEHIDLIMEGGYKLREIIDAILLLAGVSKVEKPQIEPVNMARVVENSLQRLASMIAETQAEFMFPEDWPQAVAYAPWVEEIWMNYVSNALKYGGTPPIIELGGEPQSDGMVRFWVKDNGKGLTAEQQMIIFTPFTRLREADDEIEGHGLGLSVVQRIVDKLGGKTDVESETGRGSVFSFTLPKSLA